MRKILIILVFLISIVSYFLLMKSDEVHHIGAVDIASTHTDNALYISVDGNGTLCTIDKPCHYSRFDHFSKNKLKPKAGQTVYFLEGVYSLSSEVRRLYLPGGSANNPITYESYKKQKVIFDGSKISRQDTRMDSWREGRLELRESYTILRNIEVRNMPQYGIRILGNYNLVEGCIIHSNALSGIGIYNQKDGYTTKATGGSFNVIKDNEIFNNSDIGLDHHNYNDGGNADGITIHSGVENLIIRNTVYQNSDDGIDVWRSMNSKVEYNLVYENGLGSKGDGYGIKLGGADKNSPLGANAIAQHNISFKNKKSGINVNHGKNVLIQFNTAYKNGEYGYTLEDDTKVFSNIAFANKLDNFGWSQGLLQENNSWQLAKKMKFISLEESSEDFLRPIEDIEFHSIGAYGIKKNNEK